MCSDSRTLYYIAPYPMGIEHRESNHSEFLELYNKFHDSLQDSDKRKLEQIEKNYCGHKDLMRIFVKKYYGDSIFLAEKILGIKGKIATKDNFKCIMDSYFNFRRRFANNLDMQNMILDAIYSDNNVSFNFWVDFKDAERYFLFEDYLSNKAEAFKTRKELYVALGSMEMNRLFEDLPKFLHECDSKNLYGQANKLKQQYGDKIKGQDIYTQVINKLLIDWWYVEEERLSNWTVNDKQNLKKRFFKILWYYKSYKKIEDANLRQKERLRVALESNYWPNADNVEVDWEVVPNMQKLNRWIWGDHLQDKTHRLDEEKTIESSSTEQKRNLSKSEVQAKQLELFPNNTKENVFQENIQWSQINTWATNWITIHIDRDDEDDEDDEDDGKVRYRWQNH